MGGKWLVHGRLAECRFSRILKCGSGRVARGRSVGQPSRKVNAPSGQVLHQEVVTLRVVIRRVNAVVNALKFCNGGLHVGMGVVGRRVSRRRF